MQVQIKTKHHIITWDFCIMEILALVFSLCFFQFSITVVFLLYYKLTGMLPLFSRFGDWFWIIVCFVGGCVMALIVAHKSLKFVGWQWKKRSRMYYGRLIGQIIFFLLAMYLYLNRRKESFFVRLFTIYFLNVHQFDYEIYMMIEIFVSWLWEAGVVIVAFVIGYLIMQHLFDGSTLKLDDN